MYVSRTSFDYSLVGAVLFLFFLLLLLLLI
jgi:hypothetical protein